MELIYVSICILHGIEIKKPNKDKILLIDRIAYYCNEDKKYFLPQDIYQRINPLRIRKHSSAGYSATVRLRKST